MNPLDKIKGILGIQKQQTTVHDRAHSLIDAIDTGSLPLHAGNVNDIARKLGIDVSTDAPMEVTIARIRKVHSKHK